MTNFKFYLREDSDVKDYGYLDFQRVAFRRQVLEQLSSSSCISSGDFETKFLPRNGTKKMITISK
jgi:hypothetical protein